MTSTAKSNEKLVNEKLCNTVLILDALYSSALQMFTGIYRVPIGFFCHIYGKGL